MAAKKNKGISALRQLNNVDAITSGADLNENKIEPPALPKINTVTKSVVPRALRVPKHINDSLVSMKQAGKYTGSINSYITEAIRKQLIADGHIE